MLERSIKSDLVTTARKVNVSLPYLTKIKTPTKPNNTKMSDLFAVVEMEVHFAREDMTPEFFKDDDGHLSPEQAEIISWTIVLEGHNLYDFCRGKYTQEQFEEIEKAYVRAVETLRDF